MIRPENMSEAIDAMRDSENVTMRTRAVLAVFLGEAFGIDREQAFDQTPALISAMVEAGLITVIREDFEGFIQAIKESKL